MRRLLPFALPIFVLPVLAQSPPPALLPPSITGGAAPMPVVPVSASVPKPPPAARYQNIKELPTETAAAVLGHHAAADWLAKRQQPHGRFLFGVNPALRTPLEGDSDFRQALATWAVCQAAAFTGDEKLTACGAQSILGLLAGAKDDPRGPQAVGFAAALVLAIHAHPNADARLRAEADRLAGYLGRQLKVDGSFDIGATDAESQQAIPGLALQALVTTNAPAETLNRSFACYRAKFRAEPHSVAAGTLLPATVDFCLRTKDANAAAFAFELADWLCNAQYGKLDAKQFLWAGGFRIDSRNAPQEPGYESAHAARGLAAACQLIRQAVPDLQRYQKYRPATVDALAFVRGMQYSLDNTSHFAAEFRTQYLLGGSRAALTDGNLRADATALTALAFQRFLESGADAN
jgi:hypothetical protein